MLSAPTLFDLSSFAHRQLFANSAYAWDALQHLKTYMNGLDYTDYRQNKMIADGVPLAQAVILFGNSIFAAADALIEHGAATKEGLRVTKDGQHLEGASIIMAGV